MISLEHVSFSYKNGSPVLADISLEWEQGEILGLLGHNGSGKSTLMKLIGGLLKPTKGKVHINQIEISHWPRESLYERMGILIESPSLYGHLSLLDNLKIQANYRGISYSRIENALERVEAMAFKSERVRKLSTGMLQRGGLASVILHDPDIIILDEPMNGLDPDGMIKIRELILDLKKMGKTMIISSHLLSEIEKTCDRIFILEKGSCIHQGPIADIKNYRDLEDLYVSIRK